MVIKVYIASSTGSIAVKKHQQAVVGFLESNRIIFQEVDIAMLEEQRLWMYRNIPQDKQPERGNPLPPQIFNEDRYCGDYEDFFQSKENNTVFTFLGLSSQTSVTSSRAQQTRAVSQQTTRLELPYGRTTAVPEDSSQERSSQNRSSTVFPPRPFDTHPGLGG
ncbi:SH3 domain-binding glutamic acid-rich-like protein 2 [Polymixia lowei]